MSKTAGQFNLLIGVTGSVAAIKLIKLVGEFREQFKRKFQDKRRLELRVVITENASRFFSLDELRAEGIQIDGDRDEWQAWQKIGDPILHIELRNWADCLLIAPLDANTLAKLTNGLCDNLLTCIVRAWDLAKPLFYAPAMNTHMFQHPLTGEHRAKLGTFGYREIEVIEKKLACGDTGLGAMEEVERIVEIVLSGIKWSEEI